MPVISVLGAGETGEGLLVKPQTFLQNISVKQNSFCSITFPFKSRFSLNFLGCSVPLEQSGPVSA